MKDQATPEHIIEQLKLYTENKIKLLKYEAIDQMSVIIAEVATDLIMVVMVLITFLFFSISLSLFAANLLSSYWEGFGCVALLYIAISFAARLLKVNIQNKLVQIFLRKVFKK